MQSAGRSEVYPLRLDAAHAQRVTPGTLDRYRKCGRPFAQWCSDAGWDLWTAADFDAAICEYRNFSAVTKTQFEGLVASVEFFSLSSEAACRCAVQCWLAGTWDMLRITTFRCAEDRQR